jgi:hypothetical protein
MATATVTWTKSVSTDVVGYEVYRALGTGSLTFLTLLGDVASYTDATVPNVSQNVSYGLKAVDAANNKSPMSNVVTKAVDITPPQAPVILDVVLG